MRRAVAIAAALVAGLALGAPIADAAPRPRWDTRLLALIPTPGFPALGYVHPNDRIYEGTYVNPQGDSERSRVLEYTGDGTLQRSWTVPGQDLSAEHGVQVTTSDARGRLVLLDRTPARALLLDTITGSFTRYATFADLAPCPPLTTGPNCSPTLLNLPPVPNYGAWGPDGSLYVTDFQQGVVWRVPPGGGTARIWLSDRRLDGAQFGTTGIALAGDRRRLLVAQGSSGGLGGLNPTTGKLYSVAIGAGGAPGPLQELWESRPADLPDGFAIARSGRIYVPLAGVANQIAVLAADGRELERFPQQPGGGDNGSEVPFDTPSSVRFLGTRLIVANQSFGGDAAHQALLDVEVGEPGLIEFIPGLDRTAPVLSHVSLFPTRLRLRRARRRIRPPAFTGRHLPRPVLVRFRLSEPATVTLRLERLVRGRWAHVRTLTSRRRAGRSVLRLSTHFRRAGKRRALKLGRYRVRLRARDAVGNRSRRVTRGFKVVR